MDPRIVRRVDVIIALLALIAILLAGGILHVGGFELLVGVGLAYLGLCLVYWWLLDIGRERDGTVET